MDQKSEKPVNPNEIKRNRVFTGLIMIAGGIGLYVSLRMDISLNVLLIIGLAFLTLYFYKRSFGFLLPGCILLGLGIKNLMHETFDVARGSTVSLGIGFLLIFIISLAYERRTDYWWTLIPGGLMIITGLKYADELRVFLFDNWPLAIILIGLFILIGAFRKPATPKAPPLTPPPSPQPPGENKFE